MNDKEYTYDIDKYTIGVDTNGEDGIGMTVAKIENGELHFLGNCYGENARCIDLLIKENQELKEKLNKYENPEDMTLMMMWCTEKVKDQNEKLKKQLEKYQQELEKADSITQSYIFNGKEERKISYRKCLNMLDKKETQQKEFIKWLEVYLEKNGYDYSRQSFNKTKLNVVGATLRVVLQKYKEIIGVSDETN